MQTTHRKGIYVWIAALAVILLFSYIPKEIQAASKGKVTSVKVTNLPSNTLTLKKGKAKTLKVKVAGTKKVSQAVTYQSNKTKVAAINEKGKVTAKNNGKAKITITSKANKKKKAIIQVTVGTPITKITLNKKSAKLETGKTLNLKASAAPKKASNKKVIWNTSNKKVATVSKKGVVKAVSAGTAKITAVAADGSGKKQTASITVVKKVGLKAISIINERTIKVDLTGAKKLSKSNFAVKLNSTGKGAYNKVCNIDNIVSAKDQSYLLVLEDALQDEEHVQVTVSGMGNKTTVYSMGQFHYTENELYTVSYNERVEKTLKLEGIGYSACTVTGLPRGITMKSLGNSVKFTGTPIQKGNVVSKLTAKDERGNIYTYTITWLIGSENTIAAAGGPDYYKLSTNGKASVDVKISATGGSGSYTYSLSGNTYGLKMSENYTNRITGSIAAAGTYHLKVKVSDANNKNISTITTVTIHIADTVTISGIIKDLSGNPISNARIYYKNKNKAVNYTRSDVVFCDNAGAFSTSLIKGTYDIEARYISGENTVKSQQYVQKFTNTRSGYDITIPVQKVVVTSNNPNISASNFGKWYDDAGNYCGEGDIFWLKPGRYSLTSTIKSVNIITAKINITVTEKSVAKATAAVTIKAQEIPTITANQKIDIKITGNYTYYAFTPTETKTYYFYSEGEQDTHGTLKTMNEKLLASNDDGGENRNFYYMYECNAGETYYVGIKRYNSGSATASLMISTTKPNFTASN